MVCLVIGITILKEFSVGYLRAFGYDMSPIVAGILVSIQIIIFSEFYGKLADKQGKAENHETEYDLEASLSIKLYLFKFINAFNSLFYIAFVKTHTQGCM